MAAQDRSLQKLARVNYSFAKPLIIDKVLVAVRGITGSAGANRLNEMQSGLQNLSSMMHGF